MESVMDEPAVMVVDDAAVCESSHATRIEHEQVAHLHRGCCTRERGRRVVSGGGDLAGSRLCRVVGSVSPDTGGLGVRLRAGSAFVDGEV
jgi:hypothetical protein